MTIVPDEISEFLWTDEEFNALDTKTRVTIIWLSNKVKKLTKQLDASQEENMGLQMTKLLIHSDMTFMAVGMKYISQPPHFFTSSDNITLIKDDNNPKDNTAIKVMVDGTHVAFVSREYTKIIRNVDNFENKTVQLLRNFPYSAKMKLVI
jgi:hypothetical protein